MEIDPHLRQLQEQAKLFSRFNANGTEAEPEPVEKEPRKYMHMYGFSRLSMPNQIYIIIKGF